MSMNKAEKAEMERLRTHLALAWPNYPEPQPMSDRDLDLATANGVILTAWFMNAHSREVTKGWVSCTSHQTSGPIPEDRSRYWSGSQGRGRPYGSEQDALHALRWAVSRIHAGIVRHIDAKIEQMEAAHEA